MKDKMSGDASWNKGGSDSSRKHSHENDYNLDNYANQDDSYYQFEPAFAKNKDKRQTNYSKNSEYLSRQDQSSGGVGHYTSSGKQGSGKGGKRDGKGSYSSGGSQGSSQKNQGSYRG